MRLTFTTFDSRTNHDFPNDFVSETLSQAFIISVNEGAAAIGGVFTKQLLQDMASFNERPIIFALSNPTSKAECTAEDAYKYTEGRCVFASGSPFLPVKYGDKTFHPGQGNNSYIFPGVALAVVAAGIRPIKDEVFLQAAQCLAAMVTDEDLEKGRVYPPLGSIRSVSLEIATKIVEQAYEYDTANFYPEPEDKRAFVKEHVYEPEYDEIVPEPYDYSID